MSLAVNAVEILELNRLTRTAYYRSMLARQNTPGRQNPNPTHSHSESSCHAQKHAVRHAENNSLPQSPSGNQRHG